MEELLLDLQVINLMFPPIGLLEPINVVKISTKYILAGPIRAEQAYFKEIFLLNLLNSLNSASFDLPKTFHLLSKNLDSRQSSYAP